MAGVLFIARNVTTGEIRRFPTYARAESAAIYWAAETGDMIEIGDDVEVVRVVIFEERATS